mmetsp:Transcript_22768/g.51982  ORF Transcript_22768/g.51982 Transcript_22768/m.51982 type:complete len:153 (-) Transcript_22768:52-510(-)
MSVRGRVHTGIVTTWVEERGYGFISPNDSKVGDLFVHVDAIKDRSIKKLKRGQRVKFDVELNTNPTKNSGKKFAVNVEVVGGGGSSSRGGRDDRRGRSPSRRRKDSKSRSPSRKRSHSRKRGRSDSHSSRKSRSPSRGKGRDRSKSRSRSRS